MNQMWVYILANQRNGTIYTGVTNNPIRRTFEHRTHAAPGFTAKYNVTRLVWLKAHNEPHEAIRRKRRSKAGRESGSWI